MRVCCYRVFADTGELWDCLLVVEHQCRCTLYTSVDRLPRSVSVDLRALLPRLDGGARLTGTTTTTPRPAAVVDANRLERVIKTLDGSDAFRRSVVRNMSAVVAVDNNNVAVGVYDVVLVAPAKYRLSYTW